MAIRSLLAVASIVATLVASGRLLAEGAPTPLNAPNKLTEIDVGINEQVIRLPISVTVNGRKVDREFVLTVFTPPGPGPFSTVIVSHGRQSRNRDKFGRNRDLRYYFVRRGFAVLAPTRVGYGDSGYDIDPENHTGDSCDEWGYEPLAKNVTAHIKAALDYARKQPWFDEDGLLLAGTSAGGFGSLVAAGEIDAKIRGVINFAGGIGGRDDRPMRSCNPNDIAAELSMSAKKRAIPTIWFYSENDLLWGPEVPKMWHAAYAGAGGNAAFFMFPPVGNNGHEIIDPAIKLWRPKLDAFLDQIGFHPREIPPGAPKPSDFAKIEDANAVPYLSEKGRGGYNEFLNYDVPRAFAISKTGWGSAGGTMNALEQALAACQKHSKTPCSFYAINDAVVWPH